MPAEARGQVSRRAMAERREGVGLEPRAILRVGLGTLGFLLVSMGGLLAFYHWAGVPTVEPPSRFPEPRLQSDEVGDLAAFHAQQRRALEGYAWEDRERGVLRIPVRRAVEILAARGEKGYAPLEAPEPGVPLPVRPEATRPGTAAPGATR